MQPSVGAVIYTNYEIMHPSSTVIYTNHESMQPSPLPARFIDEREGEGGGMGGMGGLALLCVEGGGSREHGVSMMRRPLPIR